jgi:hypothetical protein
VHHAFRSNGVTVLSRPSTTAIKYSAHPYALRLAGNFVLKQPNPLAAALSQSDAEAGNVVIEKNLVTFAFGQGERGDSMRCELHF